VLGSAQWTYTKPEEAYDPKSLEHILAGTYPHRIKDMINEMSVLKSVEEV
jgi:hypothetical protein